MDMKENEKARIEDKATPRPWIVQQLNHVDNELWLQIGWMEDGHGLGPICEMVGGAVKLAPSFKAVAEFKYLVAPDDEVRANAELIVRAVNSYSTFEVMKDALEEIRNTGRVVVEAEKGNAPVFAKFVAQLADRTLALVETNKNSVCAAG